MCAGCRVWSRRRGDSAIKTYRPRGRDTSPRTPPERGLAQGDRRGGAPRQPLPGTREAWPQGVTCLGTIRSLEPALRAPPKRAPSAVRTGVRALRLARHIRPPSRPSALEQVRAPIGGLDLVPDHVRQRRLDDLPGMVRLLGGPVPERRPEPMRHRSDPVPPEQPPQPRSIHPLASLVSAPQLVGEIGGQQTGGNRLCPTHGAGCDREQPRRRRTPLNMLGPCLRAVGRTLGLGLAARGRSGCPADDGWERKRTRGRGVVVQEAGLRA